MSNSVDRECFTWAAAVAPEDPSRLLLAGAFRLPVQAILFDTDENATQANHTTIQHVDTGKYLASLLLDTTCCSEHDRYPSGNMCALEVPSLVDNDDYTRMTFPDGADSIHRTAVDKVGARIAVLRRLDLPEHHPAVIMTLVSGRHFLVDVRNSNIKKCRNSSCPETSRFDVQPCLRTCNSASQMKSLVVQGLKA